MTGVACAEQSVRNNEATVKTFCSAEVEAANVESPRAVVPAGEDMHGFVITMRAAGGPATRLVGFYAQKRSPRRRRTSCRSRGMAVTRPECRAARFESESSDTT